MKKEKIMKPSLSEHQSYTIGYCCYCGADAVFCQDWESVEFIESAPDCCCSVTTDENLERMDTIIERIKQTGSFIKGLEAYNGRR